MVEATNRETEMVELTNRQKNLLSRTSAVIFHCQVPDQSPAAWRLYLQGLCVIWCYRDLIMVPGMESGRLSYLTLINRKHLPLTTKCWMSCLGTPAFAAQIISCMEHSLSYPLVLSVGWSVVSCRMGKGSKCYNHSATELWRKNPGWADNEATQTGWICKNLIQEFKKWLYLLTLLGPFLFI